MKIFCESERVYIRRTEISDAAILAKWKEDLLIRKMSIGLDTKITLEKEENDIKNSMENPGELYWIIEIKQINKPIGYIRINWMDNEERFAWLRFGLGEERGKGYAKEALKVALEKLFMDKVHRIDAEVYKFNEGSYNLLKSLGFKEEGTRRDAHYDGENYVDVIVMGLLSGELKS